MKYLIKFYNKKKLITKYYKNQNINLFNQNNL